MTETDGVPKELDATVTTIDWSPAGSGASVWGSASGAHDAGPGGDDGASPVAEAPQLLREELTLLADPLQVALPDMLDAAVGELQRALPHYADLVGQNRDTVLAAARYALARLLEVADTVADGELAADSGLDLTIAARIGEQHCRSGRELRDLIHAYRIAARVGWRHISAVALQFGVSSGTLATLAEAVFFFVDQLASASSDGFVREQAEWAAQRERAREELADLLLSDHASATAVQATAARADWRMPTTGAVVLARNASQAEHALMRLDPACLPIRTARFCGVVLPDPAAPGRRALLTRTLAGLRVVVGAAVPLQLLPESARVAETGLQLVESDVLPHRPLFIDDHLDAVIVHSSPALLGALRRQCLAPLDAFTESSRDRLVETLVAWLCHQGDRQRIAAALHIHPQTVRYRVARLREVFGETLETPAGRARLTLALCWGAPGPAPYPAPPPDTQGESR